MKTIVSLFSILIISSTLLAQNSEVAWSSFNMGFTEWQSGNIMIKSVVGQRFVGTTQQSNNQVISGFFADTLLGGKIVNVNDDEEFPTSYMLWQNYPNPFNPNTKISWQLPVRSQVTLKIYDLLGRVLKILMNEEKEAGHHSVEFTASDLPSGVYFYRLQSGSFIDTKKMLLLK